MACVNGNAIGGCCLSTAADLAVSESGTEVGGGGGGMSSVDCVSVKVCGEGGMLLGRGSVFMDGKGGRKPGICDGGFQFDVRARLRGEREGDDGFDMGERGSGGVDGRILAGEDFLTVSSGNGEPTRWESSIIAASCSSVSSVSESAGMSSMSTSSASSSLSYSDIGGLS